MITNDLCNSRWYKCVIKRLYDQKIIHFVHTKLTIVNRVISFDYRLLLPSSPIPLYSPSTPTFGFHNGRMAARYSPVDKSAKSLQELPTCDLPSWGFFVSNVGMDCHCQLPFVTSAGGFYCR